MGTGLRRSIVAALIIVAMTCATGLALALPPWPRYAQATPPTDQARALSGSEAWAAMLDNTITGTTPDGNYTEFFKSDGSFVHVDRDGRAVGHWSLKDQRVCFTYPDEDDVECRRPELDGRHGAFTDADGMRYAFELLPGNPKGL
ncbi:MAG TPA: hypothetical protein VH414_10000 [Lichenihabitans sp.]|jgi:hypothetical protein|nr:hypothetical protein [Lichenihabitans sp.]